MNFIAKLQIGALAASMLWGGYAQAQSGKAFTIGGKVTTQAEVYKEDQASFFDLDKKKYELIERIARERYLDYYWEKMAKKDKISVAEAQKRYEEKNLKVSDAEIKETLGKFKDHPSLKKLDKKEQELQIKAYLLDRSRQELYNGIIEAGLQRGDLKIDYPKPVEPVYNVEVTKADHVRYGPNDTDTKPAGCKGDACAITVVEYSEFQCPFCTRVLPDVKRIMTEYKGKIRWIVRDFPLSFHNRARPAAVAAHCSAKQGKYWEMYHELFDNQRNLTDDDFKKYAKNIGLNTKKFEKCYDEPGAIEAQIEQNFQSGVALGVTGTPAFFINGRRLSGALPYSEFNRVITEELAKKRS